MYSKKAPPILVFIITLTILKQTYFISSLKCQHSKEYKRDLNSLYVVHRWKDGLIVQPLVCAGGVYPTPYDW
jgi:hypothetical protein